MVLGAGGNVGSARGVVGGGGMELIMASMQTIQNRLDRIRQLQGKLADEETALLNQLKQFRNSGDPPFSFLYFEADDEEELYSREFRSPSLTVAAVRMARFMARLPDSWEKPRVDYEVEMNGEYINLYTLGERHPIYEYLS